MTTLPPEKVYGLQEQPELWMPTGGTPVGAYGWASEVAVPGTGAHLEYRRFVAYGGLVYTLLLEVGVQAPQSVAQPPALRVLPLRQRYSAQVSASRSVAVPTVAPVTNVMTEASASAPAITAREQIDSIQDRLSLGISHIAEILAVARGTVHSWVRGDTPIPRNPLVAERLRNLYHFGLQWSAHSEHEIGRLLTASLGDGEPSLYDLLRAARWDQERLERALLLLADRVEERRARPAREELNAVAPAALQVERQRLRSLVQRGRFYGR